MTENLEREIWYIGTKDIVPKLIIRNERAIEANEARNRVERPLHPFPNSFVWKAK
jgi:hypothetical protein